MKQHDEQVQIIDDFDGRALDEGRWVPAYLPEWSSRELARADWRVEDSVLTLSIPPAHPVWCEGQHEPPLRVSAVQSGTWSGPAGTTRGQQPFRDGLVVQEVQPDVRGWTPQGGVIQVRARARISSRSMFSVWLIGRETDPDECAEICIVEVFGKSRWGNQVDVGAGVHAFRDSRAIEDFATTSLAIDVSDWHIYSVGWTEASAVFAVDGEIFRTVPHPPWYLMQLELGVFDFPTWSNGADDDLVPMLEVDWIRYAP